MKKNVDFLKKLRDDPMYREALKSAKTDEERRRVIAVTEAFVSQFASVLEPLIDKVQSDPKFAEQLRQSLKGEDEIVSSKATPTGSNG